MSALPVFIKESTSLQCLLEKEKEGSQIIEELIAKLCFIHQRKWLLCDKRQHEVKMYATNW